MTREQVWKTVSAQLRREASRLLEVRDVRRVRKVAGDAWIVTVVLAAASGDLHVADLTVDDAGGVAPSLDGDAIVAAVRRADQRAHEPSADDEVLAFTAELSEPENEEPGGLDLFAEAETGRIGERVAAALRDGDKAELLSARELLPRMLANHEERGRTLLQMAEVELALDEPATARGYLEAAAREFADRYDLDALEETALLALARFGREEFGGSPIHKLLEESRSRLTPAASVYDSSAFAELGPEARAKLEASLTLRTLMPGEMLVQEGEPARNLFVVKSGLIGVWLEKPSGGSWLIRCCFPGWVLGESSVLGGEDPRCVASLRAERISEVWICPASVIVELMREEAVFGRRLAKTKQLHRLDSFFSMHETMGQLDVHARDELLSCLQRIETFEEDTQVLPGNRVPLLACLVARGSLALCEEGKSEPSAVIEADSFYGVRDAIHRVAPPFAAIARAGSTVAFFNGKRLQKLCERSPEHVVAVLERLG